MTHKFLLCIFHYYYSRVTIVPTQEQQQQPQPQRVSQMIVRKIQNGRVVLVNPNVSTASQLATINKTTVSTTATNSTNQRGGPR